MEIESREPWVFCAGSHSSAVNYPLRSCSHHDVTVDVKDIAGDACQKAN